jgi:hypothetical protein
MNSMSPGKLLRLVGLLNSIGLILAGCGSASRSSSITLQLTRSMQVAGMACSQGATRERRQHVQPGDPGFIERLEIRVQNLQGEDLLAPQEFTLDVSAQETMTRVVTLPATAPTELRVHASAYSNYNGRQTPICLGETLIQHEQQSAVMPWGRSIPPPPHGLLLSARSCCAASGRRPSAHRERSAYQDQGWR